jgi:hypothetical protein
MDRETFTTTIQPLQDRRPFEPFTVALVDGDRYGVDRPNILALGEGIAILIAPGGVPVFLDHEGVSQVSGDLSGRGAERGRCERAGTSPRFC